MLGTFAVVTFGLWTAAMVGIASTHGTMDRMTNGAWQSYGLTGLRGLGMILAFAALGFGLASIGRHIGLALGVALGVIILGQFGLMLVLMMARVHYPEIYLIPSHLQAWMEKRVEIHDPFAVMANPMEEAPVRILSFGDSGSIGLGVVARRPRDRVLHHAQAGHRRLVSVRAVVATLPPPPAPGGRVIHQVCSPAGRRRHGVEPVEKIGRGDP
jgi:hypothetical protein